MELNIGCSSIPKVSVSNMTSPSSGREVANQFIIKTDQGTFFQSYSTVIAAIISGRVYLDKNAWNYSVTTGKYRNQFLREKKAETQGKINSGEYVLANLN